MLLECPAGAKVQVKHESRFSKEKNISFYSEFDADSKYLEDECEFELFHNDRESITILRVRVSFEDNSKLLTTHFVFA